ncbi:MAG: hypothetical protein IPJ19_08980 [Planctomycetes bacterium]|nr:hypothetical protein [Planctomycetota bacterium]
MRFLANLALVPLCLLAAAPQQSDPARPAPELVALQQALAQHEVWLEPAIGVCAIPARVLVRADPVEYVLCNRTGNAHESLFVTESIPSRINVGLLALGVQPGKNAIWKAADPQPTREQMLAGAKAYSVAPPSGEGFLLYVAWKSGEELYFFRLEDLIRNLESGRSMRRGEWVYLGSRSVQNPKAPEQEVFVADEEGNLVNLCFFEQGNTLLTGALPECETQTIWVGNSPLLPDTGLPVLFLFSRKPLESCPKELRAHLPDIDGH